MYRFNVILASFEGSMSNFEALRPIVASFNDSLALANLQWLKTHPETPSVYDSGIRYVEDKGQDDWCDIPEVIRRGYGDCDDINAWRLGELLFRGIECKAGVDVTRSENDVTYHTFVVYPDGSTEDPAARIAGAT